jgi:hypothetical protein
MGASSPAPAAADPAPVPDAWRADDGDRPQAAYAAATGTRAQGERLWLGESFTRDPPRRTGGDLALHFRPRMLDQDLTLALGGRVENDWLRDHQRFGIATGVRSKHFELGTSLYDDVAGSAGARGTGPERRRDGYDVALGARIPELPWAWIRARRQWQTPVDGETAVSDRLSLQLGPLAPLELETGTTGEGDHRSWFAQLRVTIELGGS